MLIACGQPAKRLYEASLSKRNNTVMLPPSRPIMTGIAGQMSFLRGLAPTCTFYLSRLFPFCGVLIARLTRLMIVVFTSTAFADWVATHVTQDGNTAFNPYLTFLFYAL